MTIIDNRDGLADIIKEAAGIQVYSLCEIGQITAPVYCLTCFREIDVLAVVLAAPSRNAASKIIPISSSRGKGRVCEIWIGEEVVTRVVLSGVIEG